MRTTVELDADTQSAVDALRRVEGVGLSAAVNELIRRGLATRSPAATFRSIPRELGLRIDVSNIADALDLLEGPEAR